MDFDFGILSDQLTADFDKRLSKELKDLQRRLLEHHEFVLAAAEVAFNRQQLAAEDSVPMEKPHDPEAPAGFQSIIPEPPDLKESQWQQVGHEDPDGDTSPFILNLDEPAEVRRAMDHEDPEEGDLMSDQPSSKTNGKKVSIAGDDFLANAGDELSTDGHSSPADANSSKLEKFANYGSSSDIVLNRQRTATEIGMLSAVDFGTLEEWQIPLVMTFFDLDEDNSKTVSTDELRSALFSVGVPQARLQKLVRLADRDGNGDISFDEWVQAVKNCSKNSDMALLSRRLEEKAATLSQLGGSDKVRSDKASRCMLGPQSPVRVCFDLIILCSCLYIASIFPFVVAWEDSMSRQTSRAFKWCDRAINYVFLVDIVLNFRTAYYEQTGELVLDGMRCAKKYLTTWFLLDFFSSFPFDDMTSAFPSLQALKIMKFGKLLRMIKLMKLQASGFETLSYIMDDALHSKVGRLLSRRYGIFMQMLLLCHWLACGMKIIDHGWLMADGGVWSEYLSTVYWSMQTLTTVGYGDMPPTGDGERGYATFAMIIGGTFYGYVVGAVTSLVSSSDLNASAYWDRMDRIESWLSYHKFPIEMKKEIRRFFESFMRQNTPLNDADIWGDLAPEMQRAVGEYLIPDNVKNNPLFDGMDIGAVVQLQSILRKFTALTGSVITTLGEVGTAMFVIDSGVLQMKSFNGMVSKLGPGQSFGEEVLLGFLEGYTYTVTVLENAQLEMILESELLTAFSLLPRQLQRMRHNAFELNPHWGHAKEQFNIRRTEAENTTMTNTLSRDSNRGFKRQHSGRRRSSGKIRSPAIGRVSSLKMGHLSSNGQMSFPLSSHQVNFNTMSLKKRWHTE